mmetsp:Transcript_480/g.546  ORF Transcript_480/g.546 Transcript_480/m.546 type:complete len:392 (-) Transcript_480:178-1353(-)
MARKTSTPLTASTVLYVGQLPYEWDENIIKSVVCGSGNVVDVRLGFDYAGKNKGFCFVEYQTPQDTQKGLQLLSQIKLLNNQPNQKGQYKKLRIELSKEGLRSNAPSDYKPILTLDRKYLPNTVQLPPEMLYNGPPVPANNGNLTPTSSFTPPMNQFQPQLAPPQLQNNQFNNAGSQMLSNYLSTSQGLPQPPNLPFAIPDKINETLSQIPPAQLIELISNLKSILSGPNANRAVDVFQLSPQLATAAAQALLLMGFIDADVISESMKSTSNTGASQQQPMQTPMQNPMQNPMHNQMHMPQIPQQPSLSQTPNVQQMSNPYGQLQQQTLLPPTPQTSRWPHLPPQAVAKLSSMAPDQADLIAQVLSLPVDQIRSLPPDKQIMVTNLRAQYL